MQVGVLRIVGDYSGTGRGRSGTKSVLRRGDNTVSHEGSYATQIPIRARDGIINIGAIQQQHLQFFRDVSRSKAHARLHGDASALSIVTVLTGQEELLPLKEPDDGKIQHAAVLRFGDVYYGH